VSHIAEGQSNNYWMTSQIQEWSDIQKEAEKTVEQKEIFSVLDVLTETNCSHENVFFVFQFSSKNNKTIRQWYSEKQTIKIKEWLLQSSGLSQETGILLILEFDSVKIESTLKGNTTQ
jgi:hypothetical protein